MSSEENTIRKSKLEDNKCGLVLKNLSPLEFSMAVHGGAKTYIYDVESNHLAPGVIHKVSFAGKNRNSFAQTYAKVSSDFFEFTDDPYARAVFDAVVCNICDDYDEHAIRYYRLVVLAFKRSPLITHTLVLCNTDITCYRTEQKCLIHFDCNDIVERATKLCHKSELAKKGCCCKRKHLETE